MGTRKTVNLPAQLESARRRFERWRRSREGHSRIPEGLWTLAVKAAGRYGLSRTAQVLRLDYNALKKRANSADPPDSFGRETGTAFVELVPPERGGLPECIVELEDPGGAKMRVHMKGVEAPDLTALSRSFWGVEA